MENRKTTKTVNHEWIIFVPIFIALLSSGCATPTILKGDIHFKSEPITQIYVETDWINNSGKQLNARAQATLYYGLKRAKLCNADPGLGSMFGGSVTAAGKKTGSFDFGSGTKTWLEKTFNLPANCCKAETPERDLGTGQITTLSDSDGNAIYPYELCNQKNKVNGKTLILRPKLSRLDEKGFAIAMDVYLGSDKNLIGTVDCSAEEKTEAECIDAPVPDGKLYKCERVGGETSCDYFCNANAVSKCVKKTVEKISADFKH